ncbi:phage baseplate assembly protein V [Streptomyces sp. NPDC002758]
MSAQGPPFYGKYRGVVAAVRQDDGRVDPRGRIQATVPDVYGTERSPWALPAVPYAGDGVGLYLVPPVGASVWIEFEHGDADFPVWSGCFWAERQRLPATAETAKVLRTPAGTVTLDDSSNAPGITIETTGGLKITIDGNGIEINAGRNGVIHLDQNKVTVNRDGLEVM